MRKYIIYLFFLVFAMGQQEIEYCKPFTTYQSCINSKISKCQWDQVSRQCVTISDVMKGCKQNLNQLACTSQIADALENLAICRFILQCEEIPDLMAEKCENNLSKSGCLSITNPEQICYWKENKCIMLQEKDWNMIQQNFDSVLYSVSACSHIENYLIMHHKILWGLLGYTPNLMLQADELESGIEVANENYDNPSELFLQNNYLQSDGKFAWFTIRESKSINLRNLKISDRFREGCIALEIENDSDYEIIFSLQGEIRGVNHVYCKYLNNVLQNEHYYVFSQGFCRQVSQSKLQEKQFIELNQLSCQSFNSIYCVYFNAPNQNCIIQGDEYEYPCYPLQNENATDCTINQLCTEKQCQKKDGYYIENESHLCVAECFFLWSIKDCEKHPNCIYLGEQTHFSQIICSPIGKCDQIGISYRDCIHLKAKCQWNPELQKCFTLDEKQIQYLKCQDAFNILVCTLVTLSDQQCFWNLQTEKCQNVQVSPILVTYSYFIDYFEYFSEEFYLITTISNINLCKNNDLFFSLYDENTRICIFEPTEIFWSKGLISKYDCLIVEGGFCQWNELLLQCECFSDQFTVNKICNDLINVNEKYCQLAYVSNNDKICVYDSINYNCQEKNVEEFDSLSCDGHGFSKSLCLMKAFCKFEANLCQTITQELMMTQSCSTFHLVNSSVCKYHNKNFELCDFQKEINSCYSPSLLSNINYRETLNRFSCERVYDLAVYFDIIKIACIVLDDNNSQFFSTLKCENNFLNQKACLLITTQGQFCYWDDQESKCRQMKNEFTKCSDYENQGVRLCQGLERSLSQVIIKQNFCSFQNNKCQSVLSPIVDCGQNENMNIHRCNSLTGLDSNLKPVNMCAFVDYQCRYLDQNSYSTQILLNQILCKQANFAACVKVTTQGQYCMTIVTATNNQAVLDRKCKSVQTFNLNCEQINLNFETSLINQNFCSQAYDECYFEVGKGCQKPTSFDLNCETVALSANACANNTQSNSCIFFKNQCSYLSQYHQTNECRLLNQFSCNSYKYAQCVWIDNECQIDYQVINVTQFTCSRNKNQILQMYQDSCCISFENAQLSFYICDTPGLNQYACEQIKSTYCIFIGNECQFYRKVMCEDTPYECGDNETENQLCVLQNEKCFNVEEIGELDCNYFEETNYEFCYQFPDCAYIDKKCIQQTYLPNQNCYLSDRAECIYHIQRIPCIYLENEKQCDSLWNVEDHCPHFSGYYSASACTSIQNCNYGFTKSGFGFCYEGNILDINCENLPEKFCLEDLSHLNKNLICYFDNGQCKTLSKENYNCQFIQQYPCSYSACILSQVNQDCKYSHIDNFCKSTKEFKGNECVGSSFQECSLIKNICYFDGLNCKDSGLISQINKYGCIQQQGTYIYFANKCTELQQNTILKSCFSISKNACLNKMTKELFCLWNSNLQKCQEVFYEENKLISECDFLNERACLNIRLSNIQCFWDEIENQCKKIEIGSNDCTFKSIDKKVSMSLCGNQANNICVRNLEGKECQIINIEIEECDQYGLNEIGCLNKTSGYCQWKKIGEGGYCDYANLITVKCNVGLNKNSCLNVQTRGQFCYWDDSETSCLQKVITNCDSASYLNLKNPCLSVKEEKCQYNDITNQCIKLERSPKDCQNNYNKLACISENQLCAWENNTCVDLVAYKCEQYLFRIKCLNSQFFCEWKNNLCVNYFLSQEKRHCLQLQKNLSNFACRDSSLEPCYYNNYRDQCYTSQDPILYKILTILELLELEDENYVTPIFNENCDGLNFIQDCIKSNKYGQACIWDQQCKEVIDFKEINCKNHLNKQACLNVKNKGQYCIWFGKCFEWDKTLNVETNVNINVCKQFSVNKVYQNNSCVSLDIEQINCQSLGISKITCLNISKFQCSWDDEIDSCITFEYSNQQECKSYQQVSPYVCQMQETDQCIHDSTTNNCKEAPKNSISQGISKLGCLSNEEDAVYWDKDTCKILNQIMECNTQLKVNYLSCTLRTIQPCKYDKQQQMCTSQFNLQSLRCQTLGLNKQSCILVQNEACQFLNGKCQQFNDFYLPCNQIINVNPIACASNQFEECEYNIAESSCQTPKTANEICNIDGINEKFCQTNNSCSWNSDYQNCKCSEDSPKEICSVQSRSECIANQFCVYQENTCKLKQCYHLNKNECQNKILGNSVCYLTKNDGCQPAKACEDVIDSFQPCQTIFINSQNCLQGPNYCFSSSNYENLCPQSDCLLNQCISVQGLCRKKNCSDFNIVDCLKQQGCFIVGNQCDELILCQQVNTEKFGENASLICNQVQQGKFKCNWQQLSVFDTVNNICTNQYCELYSSSLDLCHGNEINSVSCVLTNEFRCLSCEEITEACYCKKFQNICNYENGKCNSILCSSLKTKEQCSKVSERCSWSNQSEGGTCLLSCNKIINFNECNERSGECYYDFALLSCKTGEKVIIDLSLEITIEQFYSRIERILIILYLLGQ